MEKLYKEQHISLAPPLSSGKFEWPTCERKCRPGAQQMPFPHRLQAQTCHTIRAAATERPMPNKKRLQQKYS